MTGNQRCGGSLPNGSCIGRRRRGGSCCDKKKKGAAIRARGGGKEPKKQKDRTGIVEANAAQRRILGPVRE